ncbi:Uncharacterized protein conserved in bacteria [Candidatus Ornithobacterium hominis]|uniref:Uncharacterized protein conserved in bacteria n=1 Tax=Candidatus Ornithobacterium hominis TaxID=2497989 RepID=A0A383U1M2_9FLAO|nr:endonuclease/exonuclease/phosphatase family protein [Candidatus Ornithobacterium hominis]MCT7904950.1 endonuclease/exonuclease/phosphatase family protein [Candidatus Ornithobacterium hominis]SZD73457.1 Uncharacterized protein conserved in bacteria [Candidatus Ornithobacterium hominis]
MRQLLLPIHLFLLALCYACLLNQFVGPNATTLFQFLALGFPILIFINTLLIFLWIFIKAKYALFFLVASSLLVIPLNRIYHFYGKEKVEKPNFKVLSYNVHYFYDNHAGIKEMLKEESPDLIFLQEIGADAESVLPPDEKYYTSNFTWWGIASKYPIIEINRAFDKKEKIECFYADIKVHGDTIRAINVYLESFHIEKKLVKGLMEKKSFKPNAATIYQNLNKAFKIHQREINLIQKFIEQSPHPVIVGGDFNAVPNSYEYFKIKKGLKDTFVAGGSGLGTTFHNYKFPIKIDYIFLDPRFQTASFEVKRVDYSDHFPILAEIKL